MSSEKKNGNLISIEEFIARARRFGVDFGKGDPKNRLRYYVKIGLLSHAQRKSFNGFPPNGAYLEEDLGVLLEIDKKLRAGKSIQEIKKENEKNVVEKKLSRVAAPYTYNIYDSLTKPYDSKTEVWQEEEKESETEESFEPIGKKHFFETSTIFKISFLFLICVSLLLFVDAKINFADSISYFLAKISEFTKLAQLPASPPSEEIFTFPSFEPYLTINAETAINAPLRVKEQITAPIFSLVRDEFEGRITVAGLTAEREYIFPNLSGTVCLTTGNCIGLGGEVISPGGTVNRLVKFISEREIGNSSINDLYLGGLAITIGPTGNVGIGIEDPTYGLHIEGRIQATGDICTDLVGGRCLSTLPLGGGRGSAGIGGSGAANYLPIWSAGTTLANSIIYQSGGNIGLGITNPAQKLDVEGTIKMLGFQLPVDVAEGYVLTADADGFGTWRSASGTVPMGTAAGQTLRYSGANWLVDSFLYNSGLNIGIGTTSTLATLTVAGDGFFQGPLTIESVLGQLLLKYDDGNYLRLAINGEQSLIEASNRLVFNSLTGEVRLGENVNLFNASATEIIGATFVSAENDSTVRKSNEMIFRASIPISRFSFPAQTNSTDYVRISKTFSLSDSLEIITPEKLPGTNRVYAFLVNFSDDISPTASSSWRVYRPTAETTVFNFDFSGQNLVSLDIGNPRLTATTILPDNDWRLEVSIPSANKTIRIFNIFLLAYDQLL